MTNWISHILVLCLLLPSFVWSETKSLEKIQKPPTFNIDKQCPNGSCVKKMSDLLETKITQARADECIPPEDEEDPQEWYENKTHTIDCFKRIKIIEESIEQLEAIQDHFSNAMLSEDERMCKEEEKSLLDLNNLADIEAASNKVSCTEEKKKEIWKSCGSDAACVLVSTALSITGPLAKRIIPSGLKKKGCNPNQDDCFKQLALAFVKMVFDFFEGAWGLLKSAGKGIAKGAKTASKKIWGWVTGAEDKSSTAQLSAAKASEDESFFQQLKKDFSGTMARMWTGLVASLKHWLSHSIFCQKWSGTPQFSKCLQPAEGLGCTSCKAMMTGMCAMVGVIAAEVIPAFLTGGMVTLAKYGVSGASKVAKLVKISSATSKALKSSKLATMAIKPVSKVVRKVATSKYTQKSIQLMKKSISAVSRIMLSPMIKGFKLSMSAMKQVARTTKTFVMMSPAGPVLTFGTKALSTARNVVLFPFENAMVVKSFQLGEKTFDKIFSKVGGAKIFNGVRPTLTGEAAKAIAKVDDTFIEMKVTKVVKRSGSQFVVEAEKKYIQQIQKQRPVIVKEYLELKPNIKFEKLVGDLYPELKYGSYQSVVQAQDVFSAEKHVLKSIKAMKKGDDRNRLLRSYYGHVSSASRNDAVIGSMTFTRPEMLKNATLLPHDRISEAFRLTNIKPGQLTSVQANKMRKAILDARELGIPSIYQYRFPDITKKYNVLMDAGFTYKQSEMLIRSGLMGNMLTIP
jgi:hypothetical protein